MITVLRDGRIKTRKNHECHGCEEVIPSGTLVYRQTCVCEDTAYNIYMCDRCLNWCKNQDRADFRNKNKIIKGCQECPENETAFAGYVKECMMDAGKWEER